MCAKRTSRARSAKSLAAGVQLWGYRCSLMQSEPYFGPFTICLKPFFYYTECNQIEACFILSHTND